MWEGNHYFISLLWSWPELNPVMQSCFKPVLILLQNSALRWRFSAIVPSFLSSYQSVSAASGLLSELNCLYGPANIHSDLHTSIYPSVHSLSSAMSKLHNLQSAACVDLLPMYMFYPQPTQDTGLNREIHTNLVNAVLTGLSCNDIGYVLPLLHAILHLSQKAYSTTALLMTGVRQTPTRHLHISPVIFIFNQQVPQIFMFSLCFTSIICIISPLCGCTVN